MSVWVSPHRPHDFLWEARIAICISLGPPQVATTLVTAQKPKIKNHKCGPDGQEDCHPVNQKN